MILAPLVFKIMTAMFRISVAIHLTMGTIVLYYYNVTAVCHGLQH